MEDDSGAFWDDVDSTGCVTPEGALPDDGPSGFGDPADSVRVVIDATTLPPSAVGRSPSALVAAVWYYAKTNKADAGLRYGCPRLSRDDVSRGGDGT
jgi:hypothetical protein